MSGNPVGFVNVGTVLLSSNMVNKFRIEKEISMHETRERKIEKIKKKSRRKSKRWEGDLHTCHVQNNISARNTSQEQEVRVSFIVYH